MYACGGDGTLNEVVCGMAGCPNAAVTHYPGGSGNDAIKVFSDTAPFFDLERLLDADETRFDLIRCNDTYCANIPLHRSGRENRNRYGKIQAAAACLGQGRVHPVDSGEYSVWAQRALCGRAERRDHRRRADVNLRVQRQVVWRGFNPVPEAEPDDGLLDVLLVKKR